MTMIDINQLGSLSSFMAKANTDNYLDIDLALKEIIERMLLTTK